MSSFFGNSSSGSGANTNKSSSSSGVGGWGTFLKQGLSTIESKLDTVLDINVPIPGGSSGILTSFSPNASVLPSSITGSSTTKDTPPTRQPTPQILPTENDDTSNKVDDTKTDNDQLTSNAKGLKIPAEKSESRSEITDQKPQKLSSSTSIRRSMDVSNVNTVSRKEETAVTIDPFTGMITTAPEAKRMSTPPTSKNETTAISNSSVSSAVSSTAAAAAANRERLEQRMRGIFKKPTESPTATPTPSSAKARSPADSPSSSARQSTSLDSEVQVQESRNTDQGDKPLIITTAAEENGFEPVDDVVAVADVAQEEEKQDPESEARKSLEDGDFIVDSKNVSGSCEVEPANAQDPEIQYTEEQAEHSSEISQEEACISESLVEVVEVNDPLDEPKVSILEPEYEPEDIKSDAITQQDSTNDASSLSSSDNQQAGPALTEIPIDNSYTQDSNADPQLDLSVQDDTSAATLTLNQDNITSKAIPNEIANVFEDNPLKKVLDQREEQLLKAMQEQSSLLEKLRDMEDAKAADDALKATKLLGLEKIIETQKKELDAARSSNLASQPKSIQKTLEEQRALLEDKDEQIRGLLAEGEVLSKKEFKNLTTIKTLRTKNIEAEKLQMDTQKKLDKAVLDYADAQAKISKLTEDNKQHNDTIKTLHDINQRQNKQMSKMEAELMALRDEKSNLQIAVDRAKQEISEARKASTELSNQAHAAALEREMKLNEDLRNEIDALKAQYASIESSLRQDIQELRVSLSNREELAGEKEDQLLMEIRSLQERLEQTENDSYEIQEAIDEARRPLLRQIEVLQNQQGIANRNWDRVEKGLTRRVAEAEEDVVKAQERERAARDKLDELKSQSTSHEARLEALRTADTQLRSEINFTKRTLKDKEDEVRQVQAELERERLNRERTIEEVKEDAERKLQLQHQIEVDKLKQQIQQLQQRQGVSDSVFNVAQSEMQLSTGASAIRRPSSTTGVTKAAFQSNNLSASYEQASSPTSLDGVPPTLSRSSSSQTVSGTSSMGGLMGLGGSSATGQAVAIERLNTMVRQLEGQVTFLTEQVRAANKNKDELSDELVRVTVELEELQKEASRVPGLEHELGLLQERHKAALEMLGERTEEVQELKADLADVKEALRDQISELLSQLEQARRANSH